MPSYLPPPAPVLNGSAATGASSITLVNGPSSENESFTFADLVASLEGRDPAQQLDILNERLVLENRIKEGAENLLNMNLADSLRLKVETELEMAKSKIDAIVKRIDQQQAVLNRTRQPQVNQAPKHQMFLQQRPSLNNLRSSRSREPDEKSNADHFQTALQNAQGCLKKLAALDAQAADAPSSSTGTPVPTPDLDRQKIHIMNDLVDILRRSLRVRYELKVSEIIEGVIPSLADRSSKQCRASAYRLIRHAIVDVDSVKIYAVEKEQAIKLIRTIVEVGSERRDTPAADASASRVPLSEPIMRAFIAVAEHLEDPFRLICIQTLVEILLIDIDLVARTGGMRFLLHVLGEGPAEVASLIASAFLHIVDSPKTRSYLRLGFDLEIALTAVTDSYGKGTDHADRMRGCAKVVQLMLRSWSGLMYFCMDGMRAIASLVDTLTLPSLETREIVLDMFFDLLNIRAPDWYQTFIDGRRLTMYRKNRDSGSERHVDMGERPVAAPYQKLTDQYIGLLIMVFTSAGLLEALTSMITETTTGSNLSRKATLLIAETLHLANRVLPLNAAAKVQSITRIFSMAADRSNVDHRIIGTTTLAAIDSFNRNRTKLEPNFSVKQVRPRANSVEDALRRGQRQVEQVKLKMGMNMDDKQFQSTFIDAQVLAQKEHTKWNFDTIVELIEGPFLVPKRIEEAVRVRFIRRIMSFYHPFSHRFSDMPRNKTNLKWVRLGCSLLSTLMSTTEGVRYLSNEDQFLTQIVKAFAQLDPFNGMTDSDPIFSKKRVAETLTYGYLEMLGTISRHKEGVELMEKFKVFTAFYHLSELRSREDLIKGIIEHLDYSIDGHPRIVLSKALTSSYKHIRLYATRHLGDLIRASPTANAWTLRLLVTQLYDPALEVCSLAVRFLEDACESKDILQLVVEMRPTLDHLGDMGHPLLLKFMSTEIGFRYLYDAGYIDREMDIWFHERNIYYVVQVEVFLSKVFSDGEEGPERLTFDGAVPPHFYGEMAKTDLGCEILKDKGHFSEFSQFIRRHGFEGEDVELITKLKSILWAVGNVGATEGGLPFLEEDDIVPAVLDIAEQSPISSVRGTCFFVLGLISSTSQGAEILCDYEWESTLSPLGLPTGLCMPMHVERFVSLPPWEEHRPEDHTHRLLPPKEPKELEVLTAIQNLANTVIANTASRSLAKMKSRPEYRKVFASPTMFYRALHTISAQHYRLPVRRYIIDLFNVDLDATSVTALRETSRTLIPHPSHKPSYSEVNRYSMLGRLARPASDDDMDGEVTSAASSTEADMKAEEPAPVALPAVNRTIGFDA
ncbi:Rapamycin-insensitive companion of mTOR, middle domain-containing protein [Schizophyllum amplum]|uniref:Rapamycin-insensitive companion of mTOR, middle domain-containing protein n=1 Tax=Schizophyllum amplum TaxID=97359 RepID=A0A550CGW2_9AGAR|nr:Rapamycin-insensitive companion of mTOR, middle domain-containing protein [Auriculariopsis ampla]